MSPSNILKKRSIRASINLLQGLVLNRPMYNISIIRIVRKKNQYIYSEYEKLACCPIKASGA